MGMEIEAVAAAGEAAAEAAAATSKRVEGGSHRQLAGGGLIVSHSAPHTMLHKHTTKGDVILVAASGSPRSAQAGTMAHTRAPQACATRTP